MRTEQNSSCFELKSDLALPNLMPLALVEMSVAKLTMAIVGASMMIGQLGLGVSTVIQQLNDDTLSSREVITSK